MRRMGWLAFAALAFGAWLGMGSLEKGRIGVETAAAAGGCGPGFHRGPYGGCRPNVYGGYYGAPGYYRGGVYGYRRGGVYGYRGGGAYGYRGGRVYGGRAVYGRRGGFAGGRGFHGGGRGFHGGGRGRR
ncbi:GCG_CRPN prefix-to-repeats domain-containing protein [Methylobacterium planeticum]|uniref:Uncharacterized protein n=1 Tax=Methylobacterium planeticum TaxID=2615211 RepID=A0A6N6MSI7_9HYPH|nr:hypothetical protein [Methylobacterium planeticum]KAB1072521.1 hypothetical protein F6X51_16060 [Methylobacterium planeticum]